MIHLFEMISDFKHMQLLTISVQPSTRSRSRAASPRPSRPAARSPRSRGRRPSCGGPTDGVVCSQVSTEVSPPPACSQRGSC